MRRLVILGLLALLAAFAAVPAFAADDEGGAETTTEEGATTEEEGATEAVPVGPPAVEVDLNPEEEADPPAWTYRFLIPTLILATVLIVAGTVFQYFNRVVKARYQPIE